MTLSWDSIRPLDGRRDKGFEELCAQLARAERPSQARFERKGTPDAGVECYTVLSDGTEWGWQAKYFTALGDPQWSQIDKSVTTAIEKHPRLVRYFVCVPLDRSDARVEGRRSAREKWDAHVAKWTKQAEDRTMSVEFVYWGSHELLERLSRPEHVGRVRFWFDERGFDAAWFTARLDEALKSAGPRYTPEVHVDLPIALNFEAFGRTELFFEREKARARSIREKLQSFKYAIGEEDAAIAAKSDAISSKVQAVLESMGTISPQPVGTTPFKAIVEQLETAIQEAEGFSRDLYEYESEFDRNLNETEEAKSDSTHRRNPFRDRRIQLSRLISELRETYESLDRAESLSSRSLLLLRGAAGTGKTHLLCDVVQRRVAADSPTVLLMGQRFGSSDEPWEQTLKQLDLPDLSAEKFVGALEAAAQASDSRALVMIDAINEGNGRNVWPNHLEAFLAHLDRSPWIGVVLAVRSSYEHIVIPEGVRSRAFIVIHEGFQDHEYDATRTFFSHYNLELPSTPILAPEFRNPLFLKTLCQGLPADGTRRLPRGYHGITAVFDRYLSKINEHLAHTLDFNPRVPIVRQALEAVVEATLDSEGFGLTLTKAEEIANKFLPNRGFEKSLYRGLVVEGVLVEEASRTVDGNDDEIVFIAYERFADHVAAKVLLDRPSNGDSLDAAFTEGGPLAFICDEKKYVSPGLLEALSIQVPERTGKELPRVVPACAEHWWMGEAFRQSLVWRDYGAFSDETKRVLNELLVSDDDLHNTIDVLLTVATIPEHPLNAEFLDRRLRADTTADRDSWWTIYLHDASGTQSAVDRLIEWASSLDGSSAITDEAVDRCATALAWMLTSSNRFLRDRATQALVNLLTGRLAAMTRLVERFAEVDDPYVTERVYAVAYGVAMRSSEPEPIGMLASCVYESVFASGSPPPHILLRDYARGVVERALYLESAIDLEPERIRPPYRSTWPTIPTEEEIKPLLPDWSKGSHDSGKFEWSRNRIGHSVMDDDFAWYVIGTNSSPTSRYWLSLTLDDPRWEPPPSRESQIRSLVSTFSDEELEAWNLFDSVEKALTAATFCMAVRTAAQRERDDTQEDTRAAEVESLEESRAEAADALERVLTEEHAHRLEEVLSMEDDHEAREQPGFELSKIQRYILKRVFDLGWTEERFGHFDRYSIGYQGRSASKAERIGKKYQWIAYHEILAYMSDHFQYREEFHEELVDKSYEGPWQTSLRDIDPSCTIRSKRGGTSWESHEDSWWSPAKFDAWGESSSPRDWILEFDGLPNFEEFLIATNPVDSSRWVNAQGHFNWRQPIPVDRESHEVERRELWFTCTGYLLRADDARAFLKWAETVDFWNRWMPEAAVVHWMFLGEHAWAPASRYFQKPYFGDDGWTQPNHGCPVKIRTASFEYLREDSGFDCSIDESYSLRLPVSDLVTGLGIRWSGHGADFIDGGGLIAAQDPTVFGNGPSALLLREDLLREYLNREGLTICWTVTGEKRVLGPGIGAADRNPSLRMSGAYVLSGERTKGSLNFMLDDPDDEQPALPSRRLQIVKTVSSE